MWASTAEASDATKVTATRTGGAAAGGYTLGIGQLARAHQVAQGTALASAATDDVLYVSVGGGTAVVLVVGAVLVSMLLAVAVTAASVAVCAVVLRSLLASDAKRR